jgi:hypothetical protein
MERRIEPTAEDAGGGGGSKCGPESRGTIEAGISSSAAGAARGRSPTRPLALSQRGACSPRPPVRRPGSTRRGAHPGGLPGARAGGRGGEQQPRPCRRAPGAPAPTRAGEAEPTTRAGERWAEIESGRPGTPGRERRRRCFRRAARFALRAPARPGPVRTGLLRGLVAGRSRRTCGGLAGLAGSQGSSLGALPPTRGYPADGGHDGLGRCAPGCGRSRPSRARRAAGSAVGEGTQARAAGFPRSSTPEREPTNVGAAGARGGLGQARSASGERHRLRAGASY